MKHTRRNRQPSALIVTLVVSAALVGGCRSADSGLQADGAKASTTVGSPGKKPATAPTPTCAAVNAYLLSIWYADDAVNGKSPADKAIDGLKSSGAALTAVSGDFSAGVLAINTEMGQRLAHPSRLPKSGTTTPYGSGVSDGMAQLRKYEKGNCGG